MSKKNTNLGFYVTEHGNGFHIRFTNGNTVSIQWGESSYSDPGSVNAEIAAWDKDGNWHHFNDNDTVKGYVGPEEVAHFIKWVSENKPKIKDETDNY